LTQVYACRTFRGLIGILYSILASVRKVKIDLKGIILKDDARYDHTEHYLSSRGHIFYGPHTPPENLDFIIFPFKKDIDKSIYDNAFFAALKGNTPVFSGLKNTYAANKCEEYGLNYYVIMDDRGIAVKNAVPTSEGVIAYLIGNRDYTLADSRVLVIGYGICGSDLAKRLKALGANVCALVRNREKECAAQADSVTPVYLEDLNGMNFDIYINTVPGPVLTDEIIGRAGGALFADIASKPGFNMELAKKYNDKSAPLPGIPGKYAVRAAGEIIGEYIQYVLSGRGIK